MTPMGGGHPNGDSCSGVGAHSPLRDLILPLFNQIERCRLQPCPCAVLGGERDVTPPGTPGTPVGSWGGDKKGRGLWKRGVVYR